MVWKTRVEKELYPSSLRKTLRDTITRKPTPGLNVFGACLPSYVLDPRYKTKGNKGHNYIDVTDR